jgi:hypothetical protein
MPFCHYCHYCHFGSQIRRQWGGNAGCFRARARVHAGLGELAGLAAGSPVNTGNDSPICKDTSRSFFTFSSSSTFPLYIPCNLPHSPSYLPQSQYASVYSIVLLPQRQSQYLIRHRHQFSNLRPLSLHLDKPYRAPAWTHLQLHHLPLPYLIRF